MEKIGISGIASNDSKPHKKWNLRTQIAFGITRQEEKYLVQLLDKLAHGTQITLL